MDRIDEPDFETKETQKNEARDLPPEIAEGDSAASVKVNDEIVGPQMSVMARMIAVFTRPQQLFAKMPAKSAWLVPVLVASLVSLFTTWLALPKLREMMLAAIPANSGIAASQLDSLIKIQSIAAVVISGIAVALGVFVMAAVYHFLCIVSGGEGKYRQALTVVSYAGLIGALALVFRTVLLLMIPGATFDQSFTSLALLLPLGAPKNWLMTILSSIELFSIWSLIVTSMGLTALYKMKGKKAWVIVFATWIVFVAVSVIMVAVFAPKTV